MSKIKNDFGEEILAFFHIKINNKITTQDINSEYLQTKIAGKEETHDTILEGMKSDLKFMLKHYLKYKKNIDVEPNQITIYSQFALQQ
jgi:hypothetical protein